jgi:hypothetical protein
MLGFFPETRRYRMVKKPLFFILAFAVLSISTAWAADYTVEATNSNPSMQERYYVTDSYLHVSKSGDPMVIVTTKGDCHTEHQWRCRSHRHSDHRHRHPHNSSYENQDYDHFDHNYAPDHHGYDHHNGYHYHESCGYEPVTYCNTQKGHFPLPADKIIFDGKKRVKFIGEGNYQTIGRHNRKWYKLWLGRTWQFTDNVNFNIAKDYSKVTLDITID